MCVTTPTRTNREQERRSCIRKTQEKARAQIAETRVWKSATCAYKKRAEESVQSRIRNPSAGISGPITPLSFLERIPFSSIVIFLFLFFHFFSFLFGMHAWLCTFCDCWKLCYIEACFISRAVLRYLLCLDPAECRKGRGTMKWTVRAHSQSTHEPVIRIKPASTLSCPLICADMCPEASFDLSWIWSLSSCENWRPDGSVLVLL